MKIKINKRDVVHGAMELIGCILMFYGYGSLSEGHRQRIKAKSAEF